MNRKILYIQYTNPAAYPPLEHSSRILANDGWQVLFLGTESLGASELRFPSHENIQVRQLSFSPAGWGQKLHYLLFACWTLFWVLYWQPRWVYASDHLSAPVALILSLLFNLNVLYHEHDSPAAIQTSFFQRLCLTARCQLAQRAQLCILPNQTRLARFRQETATKTEMVCVWNCPRNEEVSPPHKLQTDTVLSLYYHGNLSPQLLPIEIIRCMASSYYKIRLTVIGYETTGSQGYGACLEEEARNLGISERLTILEPKSRQELWQYLRKCDVGIALFPRSQGNINLQNLVGASNKVFDYLAGGLAVLVNDSPDWCQMIVANGYGLACDPADITGIAAKLRWFCEHPVEMRAMGEKGRQRIELEWNYETQFAPVRTRLS